MSRLPVPGGDSSVWGEVLNDFLRQAHQDDGSLKNIPISTVTDLQTQLNGRALSSHTHSAAQITGLGPLATMDEPALENTIRQQIDEMSPVIYVDDFNPGADYGAALNAAIGEAVNRGGYRIAHREARTWMAYTGVDRVDVMNLNIDWNGVKVVRSASMPNVPLLNLRYTTSPTQSVSAVDSVIYDWGDGSTYTTRVSRIAVANTSGWAKGDYAVIVSDDPIAGANPAREQRSGDRFRVAGVDANYIYAARLLRVNLSTNIRIARMSKSRPVLRGMWVEDEPGSPTNRSAPGLLMTSATEYLLEKLHFENMGEGARIVGCVEGQVIGLIARNLRTDSVGGVYGYGLRPMSCVDMTIVMATGSDLRHLITAGAYGISNATAAAELWRYGSNFNIRTKLGQGGETGHSAFDFHEEAQYCEVANTSVSYNHREPLGAFSAFQLRGARNVLRDCSSVGPAGVAQSNYDGGANHKIINHHHIFPEGMAGTLFLVSNQSMTTRGKGILDGSCYAPKYLGGTFVRSTKGDLYSPRIELVFGAIGLTRPITLVDSRYEIDELVIDLRESTVTDIRLIEFTDDISEMIIHRLKIRTGGIEWKIADFISGTLYNSKCKIGVIECDTLPSSYASGFVNMGPTAEFWVREFIVNGQKLSDGVDERGNVGANMNGFSRGVQRLNVPLTGARAMNEYTLGVAPGREILFVRTANATGAHSWNIGTTDSLTTPGTWLRRKYTGTEWITVAKGSL